MSPARKLSLGTFTHRMTLEKPGQPLPFDADRGLVEEISARCDVKALVQSLKGKDKGAARDAFQGFGEQAMKLTMDLADTRYLDRTGEMIERVAQQTSVSFPHRFERYVELGILACRPLDRWNVIKATTRELVLQVSACAINQALKEAGLDYEGMPCQALCLAGFQAAAQKTGDPITTQVRRVLPKDGLCEFIFTV